MIRTYTKRLYGIETGVERWHQEYAGLSTDAKPTGPNIVTGSIYREVDTGISYQYDETSQNWTPKAATAEDHSSVQSLNAVPLAVGELVNVVGIPEYVDNPAAYAAYGISKKGWYAFARITAREGTSVSAQTTVTGAEGFIAETGADHVDVAVRFETAPMGRRVVVNWGDYADSYVFMAIDLGFRNLDYRTTFYLYDLDDFVTWSYALTTDETFAADKNYYTESGGVYTLATVTAGEAVPANTYYTHSKVTFSGMTRNVTYKFDPIIDCPIEIVLPEIRDDGYGAWFEIQLRYNNSYSCTLLPPEGVVIGTVNTQAQTAGINVIDLQYTGVGGVAMWSLLNTHSNIPA